MGCPTFLVLAPLILWGQTGSGGVVDTLAGGAGWAGCGLLGLVLGWLLLKHLPEKDKQLEKVMERHLAVETEQRQLHRELETEQRTEFRDVLKNMLDHNRGQIDGLGNALKEDLHALKRAVDALEDCIRTNGGGK